MKQPNKQIKVIEVIADSSLSGAPRHLLTLVNHLKKDFLIEVICPMGWLPDELKKIKIKCTIIEMGSLSDLKSVANLKQILNKSNADIVHFHGLRAGWLGLLAAKKLKAKKIYSEHLYTFDYHLKNSLREKIQINGLKKIIKSIDKIIVPSMAVEEFLVGRLNTPIEKIKLINNGLDDYKVENKVEKNKFGFIGSLNEQKGLTFLIAAVRILVRNYPNLSLEIVGNGPLRGQLEKESQDLSDNIKFIGAVELISPYLATYNFLVVPSLSESFGQVVLEAAIASRPVISSNAGALSEIVEDKKTGLLVPKGDSQALSDAIKSLLEKPDLAQEMGRGARKLYEKSFTADKMASEFKKLYLEIIKYNV